MNSFELEVKCPTIYSYDIEDYNFIRDKQRRDIWSSPRYDHVDIVSYALYVAEDINNENPMSYTEAINNKDNEKWMLAMIEDLYSLDKNKTSTLVPRPTNTKLVGNKWIYKRK